MQLSSVFPYVHTDLLPISALLSKDEPKLLVVVGAGISIGATAAPQASWRGLLKHGIDHLVATDRFTPAYGQTLNAWLDEAFSPFDLDAVLRHAQLVEHAFKTPNHDAFASWLSAAFGTIKADPTRSATLAALKELETAGAVLLTTNYDSLLTDATGLPAVTWREPNVMFQVMRREKRGVLHIHGHWQRHNSIVLGKDSYDEVVGADDFQDLFKTLWLERSWLYVGCGDGLDDPNLGRLLQWGKNWKKDSPPDYFLARGDTVATLMSRPDRPANLVPVGYSDHPDLPIVLRSVVPAQRSWPFAAIDDEFELFRNTRSATTEVPFPSRQEYLDGAVPPFSADVEVRARLEKYGWALILDHASVGKTTLAVRTATARGQRDHPSYYLDLAGLDAAGGHDTDVEAGGALQRLSRAGTLLILDNIHHRPELARRLWEQWRQMLSGSRLLLIGTRIDRAVVTTPIEDLVFFEHHATNPSIELLPTKEDLLAIARHLYQRVGGSRARALLDVPNDELETWHRNYRSALGAFCIAALGRLPEFEREHWELPLDAASDWVQRTWLVPLDRENRENVLCLAVYGQQEIELQVPNEALPHPDRIHQLLNRGLVARAVKGNFGQYRHFALREPGWGALMLAAQVPPLAEEKILFETASRHGLLTLALSVRYWQQRLFRSHERLWSYLAKNPSRLFEWLRENLLYVTGLAKAAKAGRQPFLAEKFWDEAECRPSELAEQLQRAAPHHLGMFFNAAASNGRNTEPLWKAIEGSPESFAVHALLAPLHYVGAFLDVANRLHRRDTSPLWTAIERRADELAQRIVHTSLHHFASFIDTAKRQGRDPAALWKAVEGDPGKLADRLAQEPLHHVGTFLDTAKRHRRNVDPWWETIEQQPEMFAERALQTPLGDLGYFLGAAKRHGRNTTVLWKAIERKAGELADRIWKTPLDHVGSFLEMAQQHGRDTAAAWEIIEQKPDKLAELAWETPLDHLGSFLETAKRQGRNTDLLWQAIERRPDKIIQRAWTTPLQHLGAFFETARQHGRNATTIWDAIESEPEKLTELAWAMIDHVGVFLDIAKQHGRDTEVLWAALEREPERLAERLCAAPMNVMASFFATATQHGRGVEPLVQILEKRPEKLVQMATRNRMNYLAGFCHYAPDSLVNIVLKSLPASHWDATPASEALIGATSVATRCGAIGRDDLKSAIVTTLLRRANFMDFPAEVPSLLNVAWLLTQATPDHAPLVTHFLDAICTSKWLGHQYTIGGRGAVAAGLRSLAFTQPQSVRHRFANRSLQIRLQKELMAFAGALPEEQSGIIELLGSARLFGLRAMSHWFESIPLDTIAALPVSDVRDPKGDRMPMRHLQLWAGLRTVTEATRATLPVPGEVIANALELWRGELEATAVDPGSTEHRLNVTMVAWLELCARSKKGLQPPRDTLDF